MQISNLSEPQLKKIIQESQAELTRRDVISRAAQDITKVLRKYNLTMEDIDLKAMLATRPTKPKRKVGRKASLHKKTRPKVAPKFKSLDSTQTWTGRGKSPRWVVAICEQENFTIDAFKKDPRFKI